MVFFRHSAYQTWVFQHVWTFWMIVEYVPKFFLVAREFFATSWYWPGQLNGVHILNLKSNLNVKSGDFQIFLLISRRYLLQFEIDKNPSFPWLIRTIFDNTSFVWFAELVNAENVCSIAEIIAQKRFYQQLIFDSNHILHFIAAPFGVLSVESHILSLFPLWNSGYTYICRCSYQKHHILLVYAHFTITLRFQKRLWSVLSRIEFETVRKCFITMQMCTFGWFDLNGVREP